MEKSASAMGFPLLLLTFLCFSGVASASRSFSPFPRFLGYFARSADQRGPPYRYQTYYHTQTLDHFGFADLPSFRQRYLFSSEHWSGDGTHNPIFFYCGNEGDIEWFAANTGFVWDIAPRFGAMVVFAEHRYYGHSMPFGNKNAAYKNTNSLAYLTTEQALADFATLIVDLKRNLSAEDSPVVLFGGSYGGMLAAWMRLKYPHIAIGALASSAPILQFEDLVPPETFYNIVSSDFRRESVSCFKTIKESWNALQDEGSKADGLQILSRTFNLCWKLNSTQELLDWLSSAYSYLAMANYPYAANFLMPLPAFPVKEVCKHIDNHPHGTSIFERIFAGISIYYNYTGTVKCFDVNDDPHGMSGWDWQACTEMIMPMSSSKTNSMFPTYDFYYPAYRNQCFQSYGAQPRPRWITTEFGGHDLKIALENFGSNIIFSNGLLDPWSGGSVLRSISSSIVALVTEQGAHHLDLRPSTADDPVWLIKQRETEIHIIQGWLDDYFREKSREMYI